MKNESGSAPGPAREGASDRPVIRAVIFDYGNVLTQALDGSSIARMAALSGLPAERFLEAYFRDRGAYDRGDVSLRDYWSAIMAPYGREPSDELLERLLVEDASGWMLVRRPMLDWALRLRGSGLKSAILSNMPIDHCRYIKSRFAWMGEFDVGLFSAEVRLVKPEPAIYRLCLERLGLPAEAALFIDDLVVNVEAARAEGLNALLFESERGLAGELAAFPELPAFD